MNREQELDHIVAEMIQERFELRKMLADSVRGHRESEMVIKKQVYHIKELQRTLEQFATYDAALDQWTAKPKEEDNAEHNEQGV